MSGPENGILLEPFFSLQPLRLASSKFIGYTFSGWIFAEVAAAAGITGNFPEPTLSLYSIYNHKGYFLLQ